MRPLVDVLVDAGCQVVSTELRRALRAAHVDVTGDVSPMAARGGILLLGARTADGASSLGALRRLRATRPELVVYLCDRLDRALAEQLVRYARAGLDRFFALESAEDEAAFAECVRMRSLAPLPEEELRALADLALSGLTGALVEHALRNAWQELSVSEVSSHFGRSPRSIEESLQKANLPSLHDLVRCGRYLHLLELKRAGVNPARERARRAGFGSATDARKWQWLLRDSLRKKPRLREFAVRLPALRSLADDAGRVWLIPR